MNRLALASASLLALAAVHGLAAQAQVAPRAAGPRPAPPPPPPPPVVAHTVATSRGSSALTFELADGRGTRIALRNGHVLANEALIDSVDAAGPLAASWRELLGTLEPLEPADALRRARAWKGDGLPPAERAVHTRIAAILAAVGAGRGEMIPPEPPAVAAGRGRTVRVEMGGVESAVGDVAEQLFGLIGVFLAFAGMGAGLATFGRRYLETVSDTVRNAPGRSFFTGLLAQMFFLPVFVLLVIGLTLTIVGILALPFAIVGYALAGAVAGLLGLMGAAHAMGEAYARRKMAGGAATAIPSGYVSLFRGLAMLAVFWAVAVLFGWVPLAGWIVRVLAAVITWLWLTLGLGAALISRFGVRDTFAGRAAPALSDEFLWATPVGASTIRTVQRPGSET